MSGGSFDYLYNADLVQNFENVTKMRDEINALCETAYAQCVRDTQFIVDGMRAIMEKQQQLENIWHAIEWWRSSDYSKMQAMEAIVEYEKKYKNDGNG